MNNYEIRCFNFIKDFLMNRPQNPQGGTARYSKADREKYIEVIEKEKEFLYENRASLTQDCFNFLNAMCDGMLEIIESGKI